MNNKFETELLNEKTETETDDVDDDTSTEQTDLTNFSEFSQGNFGANDDKNETEQDISAEDKTDHEQEVDVDKETRKNVEIYWSDDKDELMTSLMTTSRHDISAILSRGEEDRRRELMLQRLCPACLDIVKHFKFQETERNCHESDGYDR